MVFNVSDVTRRHRFPFAGTFETLGSSTSLCLLMVFQIGDLYQERHELTAPGLLSLDASREWPTTIRTLIEAIFAPYLNTDGQRLSVNGPDLEIRQESITALALVLYELATNAIKYGSLSLPTGIVQIEIALAKGNFDFVWKERGGPKLIDTPNRDGFGTSLVRRIVVDQFRGEIAYDWDSEGLVVRLLVPAAEILLIAESGRVMESS